MRTSWNVLAIPMRAIRCALVPADRLSAQPDLAAAGPQRAGDHVERGRLAGAVGAEQADDLALAMSKLMPLTAVRPPKRRVKPGKGEQRGHGRCSRVAGAAVVASRGLAAHQVFGKSGDAARQQEDDHDEQQAEQDRVVVGEVRRQPFEQQEKRDCAERWPPEPGRAAEQRHDQRQERHGRIEDDRRLDVGPARRLDRPHQRDDDGADDEEREFGAGDVDADMRGDDFVVGDDLEREARAGTGPPTR